MKNNLVNDNNAVVGIILFLLDYEKEFKEAEDPEEIRYLVDKFLQYEEPYEPYNNDNPKIIRKRNDYKWMMSEVLITYRFGEEGLKAYLDKLDKLGQSITGNDKIEVHKVPDQDTVFYTDPWNN